MRRGVLQLLETLGVDVLRLFGQALRATPPSRDATGGVAAQTRPIAALGDACRAYYLDGLFEEEFVGGMEELAEELPGSTASHVQPLPPTLTIRPN